MMIQTNNNGLISAKLSRLPLGRPLAAASLGTLVMLFCAKRYHALFGIVWAGLSLIHAWQHFGHKPQPSTLGKIKHFLEKTTVGSYLPGRVRLYNQQLVGNDALAAHVEKCLMACKGVEKVTANAITGSLLVTYDQPAIRSNPVLGQLETYLSERAAIR